MRRLEEGEVEEEEEEAKEMQMRIAANAKWPSTWDWTKAQSGSSRWEERREEQRGGERVEKKRAKIKMCSRDVVTHLHS